jgi:dihydroneopterin aldolase
VSDEERSRPQPLEVDVLADLDVARAATSDLLKDALDYTRLQSLVMATVEATSFHLLETLAATIGRAVLDGWPPVTQVEVAVRKPEADMPGPVSRVEVRVRRSRVSSQAAPRG